MTTGPSGEDSELEMTLKQMETAYAAGDVPPPDLDEVVTHLSKSPSGLTPDEFGQRRRRTLEQLSGNLQFGELVRKRREVMGLEVDELAARAKVRPTTVDELEQGDADLHMIDAGILGNLLYSLGLDTLGIAERPLRELAEKHLAIYRAGLGQVFGRTRKAVRTHTRRRDLLGGIAESDRDATRRAVETYLTEVRERLNELGTSQSR
jgi:transcriptional regulator with XRE-family HTH domain